MITAQVESFIETLEELKPILPIHWKKLALNQDEVPLDPRYDIYFEREHRGELMFVTIRDLGKLVGYWIAVIAPGLHYKTCLTGTMDIWNVLPEYERTRAPLVLMNAVESEYRRRGVNRAFAGEKLHRPCGKLYLKYGYEPCETYYSKWIGY
jgi:hypothetical protein